MTCSPQNVFQSVPTLGRPLMLACVTGIGIVGCIHGRGEVATSVKPQEPMTTANTPSHSDRSQVTKWDSVTEAQQPSVSQVAGTAVPHANFLPESSSPSGSGSDHPFPGISPDRNVVSKDPSRESTTARARFKVSRLGRILRRRGEQAEPATSVRSESAESQAEAMPEGSLALSDTLPKEQTVKSRRHRLLERLGFGRDSDEEQPAVDASVEANAAINSDFQDDFWAERPGHVVLKDDSEPTTSHAALAAPMPSRRITGSPTAAAMETNTTLPAANSVKQTALPLTTTLASVPNLLAVNNQPPHDVEKDDHSSAVDAHSQVAVANSVLGIAAGGHSATATQSNPVAEPPEYGRSDEHPQPSVVAANGPEFKSPDKARALSKTAVNELSGINFPPKAPDPLDFQPGNNRLSGRGSSETIQVENPFPEPQLDPQPRSWVRLADVQPPAIIGVGAGLVGLIGFGIWNRRRAPAR